MKKGIVKGYVYDYDPRLRRKVVFVVIDSWAFSLATGYRRRWKEVSEGDGDR